MTFSDAFSPKLAGGPAGPLPSELSLRVREIIAEQAGCAPDQLSEADSIESLGLDSLGLVEMIFALEESFGISVPFNANEPEREGFDIASVGAIIAAVERLVAGRAA